MKLAGFLGRSLRHQAVRHTVSGWKQTRRTSSSFWWQEGWWR